MKTYSEKKVSFYSFDGTKLVGVLTVPEAYCSSALLMVHGLPSDKDEWGLYSDMSVLFANHGIASFRFDFREMGESEKVDLARLTISSLTNDIEAAYWQLHNELSENTNISIVGTSAGGGVSLAWVNSYQRKLRNIFLMAPVLDYVQELVGYQRIVDDCRCSRLDIGSRNKLKAGDGLNDEIGYQYQMANEAQLFDVSNILRNIYTPIDIYHGDEDSFVPISITRKIVSEFKSINLHEIEGADHGFAVSGDDDLVHPGTKENHQKVFLNILGILQND